uniref:Insulin-like peptide 1 n=1 Tax=Gnatocerus cornutus TaxID=1553328 RepID=A0A7G1GD39_9CUCU|nr:insulin-like peptide 1 [Gnatocerus cornutus]
MDKRVIFLVLVLNVIFVWSSPHLTHLMNKREFFCGNKLTESLALVCKGIYNSPGKKSSMNDLFIYGEYDELFPNGNDDDNQLDFPFLQKETANSFVPVRFRRKAGIVDECCHNPCTYKHLSLYCA